ACSAGRSAPCPAPAGFACTARGERILGSGACGNGITRSPPARLRERAFPAQTLRSRRSRVRKIFRPISRRTWPRQRLFLSRRMSPRAESPWRRAKEFPEGPRRLRRERICRPRRLRSGRDGLYGEGLCRRPPAFSSGRREIKGICGRAFGSLFRGTLSRDTRSQRRSLRHLSTGKRCEKPEPVSRGFPIGGSIDSLRAGEESRCAQAIRSSRE